MTQSFRLLLQKRILSTERAQNAEQDFSDLRQNGFAIFGQLTREQLRQEAQKEAPMAFLLAENEETIAICQELRKNPQYAFVPLFVLSAKNMATRLQFLSAGADDCGPFFSGYLPSAIQARLKRLESLRDIAFQDQLTGLLTLDIMQNLLPREIAQAKRSNLPLCLSLVDIDRLKLWNKTYGWEIGDHVLSSFGEALQHGLRDTDIVASVGGGEFIILFPDARLEGAKSALERCRQLLHAKLIVKETPKERGSFSAGITQLLPEDENGNSLLARAGKALYYAKKIGRNRIEVG